MIETELMNEKEENAADPEVIATSAPSKSPKMLGTLSIILNINFLI